jgi:dipeptidase
MWRVFSLAGADLPSENISPYADEYPFSVPVTRPKGKFSVQDIIDMQRDHYEGTPYSTTEGLAGGPYGDPNRYTAEVALVCVCLLLLLLHDIYDANHQ